uniref:Uncharacterized protein n=1 Tax=Monopterus albus TaxID=43700 RepID=A0A3Q3KB17_MONAL
PMCTCGMTHMSYGLTGPGFVLFQTPHFSQQSSQPVNRAFPKALVGSIIDINTKLGTKLENEHSLFCKVLLL